MGEVVVDPHALKHGLSEEEVRYAWDTPIACRQRSGELDPPTWIAIGVLPDGRMAELVALEDNLGRWHVFHAMVPPTKKFLKELEMTRR
jgi:hypothetical protein